jgi:hypothetical protein
MRGMIAGPGDRGNPVESPVADGIASLAKKRRRRHTRAMEGARPAKAVRALALLPLVLIALGSCGPRAVAWGVLLWGDLTGPFATGSVVAITRDSQISDTYLVAAKGERQEREFTKGRVRAFAKRSDAVAEAAALEPWLSSWGFSRKEDTPPLPIRERAEASSRTVYRLRYGQLVKVVGRSADRVDVKPYTDYWYEVVTDDGFGGWVFGHYLKVFTAEGEPTATQERLLAEDDTLERIMGTTWRPDYFRKMINDGRIDLTSFREDIGLFPDPEHRTFRLVLTHETREFPYQRIERSGTTTYAAVGSDLRITVLDEERISVSYRNGDLQAGGLYATIDQDVAEVIAAELQRRQDLFDRLRSAGATLASSSYGVIRLETGMRFTWQGFERLVPSLIGAKAKGSGRVDFPYHVGKELAGQYDGVITLQFDDGETEVSFLVKNASGGVRFTSLGRDGIEDLDAVRVGISPVVIFFSQSP